MPIYQITHMMNLIGQGLRYVTYYETPGPVFVDSEWVDVADEIRGYYDTHLKTLLTSQWAYFAINHRRIDTAGFPGFDQTPAGGALLGTNVTDPLPTQICCLTTAKGSTVKPNAVRTYFGGFTDGSVVNGLWGTGVTTACNAFVSAIDTLNAAGTVTLTRVSVKWNSTRTFVVDANPVGTNAILSSTVPATQRSRRIGKGM